MKVIEQGAHVAIHPMDVNITDPNPSFMCFWEVFNNRQAEDFAFILVTEAQKQESWEPIPASVISSLIVNSHLREGLADLVSSKLIVFKMNADENKYYFTYEFVGKVYGASPDI